VDTDERLRRGTAKRPLHHRGAGTFHPEERLSRVPLTAHLAGRLERTEFCRQGHLCVSRSTGGHPFGRGVADDRRIAGAVRVSLQRNLEDRFHDRFGWDIRETHVERDLNQRAVGVLSRVVPEPFGRRVGAEPLHQRMAHVDTLAHPVRVERAVQGLARFQIERDVIHAHPSVRGLRFEFR
jgi:hypothetical protein